MGISAKEKSALQDAWEGAKESSDVALPDGKWQFAILGFKAEYNSKNIPMVTWSLEVIGGNDDYLEKKFDHRENMSEVGMSIFKKNLRVLDVEAPDGLEQLFTEDFADEVIGKRFQGDTKEKKGWLNLYFNQLIEGEHEGAVDTKPEAEVESEPAEPEQKVEDEGVIEAGDTVRYAKMDTEGEVLEVLEQEEKARVKLDSDGKVYRILLTQLEIVYDDPEDPKPEQDPEPEAEVEEDTGGSSNGANGRGKVPTPEEVEEMRRPQLNDALKKLGFKHTTLKQPRQVLESVAKVIHEANVKLGSKDVTALANALGIKLKRGIEHGVASRTVKKEVKARFKTA